MTSRGPFNLNDSVILCSCNKNPDILYISNPLLKASLLRGGVTPTSGLTSVTPQVSTHSKNLPLELKHSEMGGKQASRVFPHTNPTFPLIPADIIRAADQVHREKQ